jgi:PAS domain S-box-containing protein
MKNNKKTKEQLVSELAEMRYRVAEMEKSAAEHEQSEKNLIESEERYRTAIEHSNDGVALVRQDQHIYVNHKFLEMFGYEKSEDILNIPTYMTVHTDDRKMVMDYNRKRQKGESVPPKYEFKGIKKDGTIIFVEVSVAATVYRGAPCSLAYLRDITFRKQAEEKLRRYKEQLEELVEERTNELIMANEQLQNKITEQKKAENIIQALNKELEQRVMELKVINRELKTFGYSISHDLKTPLVTIGGFARRLLKKYAHILDEKGQKYIKIINENSLQMEELIDDLLAFFRVGNRSIKQSQIKMDTMVQEIFYQFKAINQGRTIQLNMKALPDTKGDRTMIRQVLTNIMSNAIKYSKHREITVIEVAGWAEKEESIYCVKDNGIGFPSEYTGRLFSVFERLGVAEEFEGTGLGLAIVKHVINRHGGRVWAEGKPGEGATFYFTLPRMPDSVETSG